MKGHAASMIITGPRGNPADAYVRQPPLCLQPAAIAPERRNEPAAHLTPRQLEVLSLLCEGLPNKLICRRLNIATGTVKIHISCILRELGVTSRLQAVVSAHRCGLLGEPALGSPDGAEYPQRAGEPAMAA